MKKLEADEITKKIKEQKKKLRKPKQTKALIIKESIIRDNNENLDIEETTSKVKYSEEAATVTQEMEKIIRGKKPSLLWLA